MWILCALVATHVAVVRGFSGGAGEAACETMIPQHGPSPQSTPSPYTLSVVATTYSSNEEISVTLAGAPSFKGYMIQARTLSGQRIGTFSLAADQNHRCSQVTSRGCGGGGRGEWPGKQINSKIMLLWHKRAERTKKSV